MSKDLIFKGDFTSGFDLEEKAVIKPAAEPKDSGKKILKRRAARTTRCGDSFGVSTRERMLRTVALAARFVQTQLKHSLVTPNNLTK